MVFPQCDADGAFRIVQVAEYPRCPYAGGHARRLFAVLDALLTKSALVGKPLFLVDEAFIVRAGRDTGLAADATIVLQQNHPVILVFVGRARGTVVDARRIVAVIAQFRAKLHAQLGELSLDIFHHPGSELLGRDLVFLFAGNNAKRKTRSRPSSSEPGWWKM